MRVLRKGTPTPEMWDEQDVMVYLGCDVYKAEEIMKECRKENNLDNYGAIEKHLILDFINEKQRIEREREARYNADIATAESVAVLEEQVKTLKEQIVLLRQASDSSSADAGKARTQALISNFISGISITIAIIALILKTL